MVRHNNNKTGAYGCEQAVRRCYLDFRMTLQTYRVVRQHERVQQLPRVSKLEIATI
jgi:hypothetical protein